MYVVVVQKFTFAISSPDEFLCFLALPVTFLFVCEISRDRLNGFAPNSQGRRVLSLARTSLNAKVKGQGHLGQNRIIRAFRRPAYGLCLVKDL